MRGFISAEIKGREELDENGEPNFTDSSWGDLVPCKYDVNEWDNKGAYQGGEFQKVAFTITTTDMNFKAEVIRLYDDEKALVFESKVISLLKLKKVQRVKIKI